jgi:hypothetical protein
MAAARCLISRGKADIEAMGDGDDLAVEIKWQVLEDTVLSLPLDRHEHSIASEDARGRNDSPRPVESFAIFGSTLLILAKFTPSSSPTFYLEMLYANHWVQTSSV